MFTAGGTLTAPVWIMKPAVPIKLAAKRDTAGGPAFPNISISGGELRGPHASNLYRPRLKNRPGTSIILRLTSCRLAGRSV
jgi:hypothetical protein